MRIGSLFSGAGGLDLAAEAVFGGKVVWQSEIDKAASKVLAHRFPDVPNLGDIKGVEWVDVPAVDVLCGGFPCQDVSAAGKRAGIKDGTRSGLWAIFAEAIDQLRPRFVVIENVRGLLSATAHRAVEDDESGDMESVAAVVGNGAGRPVLRAAGAVLGDLATLGYDAQWTTLAAAAVGAPHRRERVFVLAADTKHSSPGGRWPRCGEAIRVWQTGGAVRQIEAMRKKGAGVRNLNETAVHELLSTPQSRDYKGVPADNFNNANLCRDVANAAQWGKYAPAIARWERIVGPAPAPTEPNRNGKPRLNPEFSSWMMGWPAGWVTDPSIGISRNDQLRIVGNGVCPQQAIAALRYLLAVTA